MEIILSHLTTRMVDFIAGRNCLYDLRYLLEFLAAWEKRPEYLTPMAYQWCSAISAARGLETPYTHPSRLQLETGIHYWVEGEFSKVGPHRDPVRSGSTCHHAYRDQEHLHFNLCPHLLSISFEIGFRRVAPSRDHPILQLDHTSHHEWAFETAFSSGDDEVIADAVCVWVVGADSTPPGSHARYLSKRVGWATPFSPRLRQASICVIDRIWDEEFEVSGVDTARWLNCLNINVDDMGNKGTWARRLVAVIRFPTEFEGLSSHYWRLLDELVVASALDLSLTSQDTEVMRSLEKAEDWERLGVWMVVVWSFLPWSEIPGSESMEGIEEVTLKLLLRQPSALPRFKDLCDTGNLSDSDYSEYKAKLQRICDQARAEQSASESPPPP